MDLFEDLVVGRRYLLQLRHEIEDYKTLSQLPTDIFLHIDEYVAFAQEVLNKNKYLNKPGAWYPYPVKSSNSIKGKRAELCYVVLANSESRDGTTYHFFPDARNRFAERQGKDCICKNPKWGREYYTIQVKYTVITDDTVLFRPRFFKYKPDNVSRLVLADPDKRIAVEMNYYLVAKLLDMDVAISRNDEEGKKQILVPYERLKQKEKALHLHRYEYKW